MFTNQRYCTRGVMDTIPMETQIFIWYLVDSMNDTTKDYLQVFRLSKRIVDGKTLQHIVHMQEQPDYKAEYDIYSEDVLDNVKLFAIDDGDHSTLLLAEEY